MPEGFAHVARKYLTAVVLGASYAHRRNIRDIMCHFIECVEVITECLVCYFAIRREIDEDFIYGAFGWFPDPYCAECSRNREL